MEDLTNPLKYYKDVLKEKIKEEANNYFSELIEKNNVNVEENRQTVKEYNQTIIEKNNFDKKINKYRRIRKALIIILFVLAFGLLIEAAYLFNYDNGLTNSIKYLIIILSGIIFLVYLVLALVNIFTKLNKIIKETSLEIKKLVNQINGLKDKAYSQMAQLNASYDWNIPSVIWNKCLESIKLDKYFDPSKFEYLKSNYGLSDVDEEEVSTVFALSGEILGNPFVLCKDIRQSWYEHVYSNSLTVTWTTYVHTKDGTRAVHHSETLVAYVRRPAPRYDYNTYLVYGNNAAPDLKFSRGPSGITNMNEKQIQKMIKKEVKGFDKKAYEALTDNDPTTNYQRFGNDEFESLYGGTDRNNELQYRLLFTPLAQRNLLQFIKEKEPFGDDWYFLKEKKLNYVQSYHSQNYDYSTSPSIFNSYSVDIARNIFLKYVCSYCEYLFYDLIPIASIPLYAQTPSQSYLYGYDYEYNITSYDHEVIANNMNPKSLVHPESATHAIYKTKCIKKNGTTDICNVTAHTFKRTIHVEIVSVLCHGNGRHYNIPVTYYEYEPLEQNTYIACATKDISRNQYILASVNESFKNLLNDLHSNNTSTFTRGLFGCLIAEERLDKSLNILDELLNSKPNVATTNNDLEKLDEVLKKYENEVNDTLFKEESDEPKQQQMSDEED